MSPKKKAELTVNFTLRISKSLRATLQRIGQRIERSETWIIRKAVIEWLRGKGLDQDGRPLER